MSASLDGHTDVHGLLAGWQGFVGQAAPYAPTELATRLPHDGEYRWLGMAIVLATCASSFGAIWWGLTSLF